MSKRRVTGGAEVSPEPPGATSVTRVTNAPGWILSMLSAIDKLGFAGGIIAAVSLLALTCIILLEIVVRLLSNFVSGLPAGVPGAWENSAFLMGIAFMSGAAMTLRAGAHIRVSVLLAQVPAQAKRWLEIVACLLGLWLTAFLAWSLGWFTWASYSRGQTSISSDTPLWIPEAAITLGAILLALQMFARLLQAFYRLPVELPHLKAGASE